MSQAPMDDELAFERRLLGAGLAEALPNERTEAALQRFGSELALLQGGVGEGVAGRGGIAGTSAWPRRVVAAQWLVVGALVGSVATFMWVRVPAPADHAARPVAVPLDSAEVVVAPPAMPSAKPSEVTKDAARDAALEPRRRARAPAPPASLPAPHPATDLAAEIAALDGVRTALAIGAWGDAEQQLTRYRRDFAQGALRNEATVLWIETLLGQGNRPSAASVAARFVAQHPRDPQVARIRALVE